MTHAETSTEALTRLEPQIAFLLEKRNHSNQWHSVRGGLKAWLEWLETHEGDSWAARWTSGEASLMGNTPVESIGGVPLTSLKVKQGLVLLFALELVRPSYDFILAKDWPGVSDSYTYTDRQEDFQAIYDTSLELKISKECQGHARSIYTKLSLRTGKRLHEFTLDDFLEVYKILAFRSRPRGGTVFHAILRHRGIINDRPMNSKYFLTLEERSVDVLIKRYSDDQAWWSPIFRAFLIERQPVCEVGRLSTLARNLLRHFWQHIIEINPSQTSFQLTWEISQTWKRRLREQDGKEQGSNQDLFIDVRTFYHFLEVMAEQDPNNWAKYGAHCPVSAAEVYNQAQSSKRKKLFNNFMLSQSLPEVPTLLRELRAAHLMTMERLAWARSLPVGASGTFKGETYRISESNFKNDYFADDERVVIRNLDTPNKFICASADEDRTFWLYTSIELLLQTGLRVAELLNLEVSNISTRRDTDGNIVPIFRIPAQKTVRPRILDLTPTTLLIVDRVIERVKGSRPTYPLASIYIDNRRAYIQDKPLLMQRVVQGRRMGVHRIFLNVYLSKLQNNLIAKGTLSKDFNVTPKDFRKIYATALSRNGVTITQISQLLGHTTIEMTRSYIIDDDVQIDIDSLLNF